MKYIMSANLHLANAEVPTKKIGRSSSLYYSLCETNVIGPSKFWRSPMDGFRNNFHAERLAHRRRAHIESSWPSCTVMSAKCPFWSKQVLTYGLFRCRSDGHLNGKVKNGLTLAV